MTEDESTPTRSAGIAFALGLLVPGLGHWYLGLLRTAVSFAVLFTGLVPLTIVASMLAGLDAGIVIWGVAGAGWVVRIVAAGHAAWRARSAPPPRTKAQTTAGYVAFAVIVGGLGVLGTGSVRDLVVEPFKTPSMSGAPTLIEGDHFAIAKLTERDRGAQRGDLIVFPYPDDPREQFVKRVVGLPGETLELADGPPKIDGVALEWSDCPEVAVELPPRTFCVLERTPEGVGYPVWRTELGDRERLTFTVPEGHVFVLGDHRDRSHDSRQFGPVPRDSIVGRAVARWLPLDRAGTLIPDGAQ